VLEKGWKKGVLFISVKYCSGRDSKFMEPERARFCNFMASENSSVKEVDDKHFLSKLFLLCFQFLLSVKFPTSFRSRTQQPCSLLGQC